MERIIVSATKIEYRTDGKDVWRFSSLHKAWAKEPDMTPAILQNCLDTGNAYYADWKTRDR